MSDNWDNNYNHHEDTSDAEIEALYQEDEDPQHNEDRHPETPIPGEDTGPAHLTEVVHRVEMPSGRVDDLWKDRVDFANFAVNYLQTSEEQKQLITGLANVRVDSSSAAVAQALERDPTRAVGLSVVAPMLRKILVGEPSMMEGVKLSSTILQADPEVCNGVARVVGWVLEDIKGATRITWSKNTDRERFLNRLVQGIEEAKEAPEKIRAVTAIGDLLLLWPGERAGVDAEGN